MKRWKIAGINFDHQHMGDLLRHVLEHPDADIVGVAHEEKSRMKSTIDALGIDEARVFTDYKVCLEQTTPDIVILCPATGSSRRLDRKGRALGRTRPDGKALCRVHR